MERQKWEYLIFMLYEGSNIKNLTNLDKVGQDGWELVSVDNGIAYFKRPVIEEQPDTAFPAKMNDVIP